MAIDLQWMSVGGCLLDGAGDLALSTSPLAELQSMTATRLKASFDGWKLYAIGCGFAAELGQVAGPDAELRIQRRAQASLSMDFLPQGAFSVKTLTLGGAIQVFVYLNNPQSTLLATTKVPLP